MTLPPDITIRDDLRAGDLELPPGVKLLSDPELPLASVHARAAEEEAAAEGEEGAEGAEAPPAGGDAPAEPAGE